MAERHYRDECVQGWDFRAYPYRGGCPPRAYSAKNGYAPRGKSGLLPILYVAMHVAAPLAYSLGQFSWLKSRGLELRKAQGPWALRRVASYRKRGIGSSVLGYDCRGVSGSCDPYSRPPAFAWYRADSGPQTCSNCVRYGAIARK